MSFFFNFFKSKLVAPERVPTDTVIPLHSWDDTKTNRKLCIYFSARFDDVLDVEKLVGALERLLERPGWRKLGARMRLNEQDKLEYHIPKRYTPSRPAINFTHASHSTSISDHPLASQIPHATSSLSVSGNIERFRDILTPPDQPSKLEDWIYTDRAQLQLHVVSFTDATLVTLTWLHTLLDAMGRNQLLRAWSAMLEGREQDIPDLYGYDFDPLATLGAPKSLPDSKLEDNDADEEEEPFVLAHKMLKGWKMLLFAFRFVWDLTMHRAEHQRMICIPPSFLSNLKTSAMADLKNISPLSIVMDTSNPSFSKPFLSDGDILAAWWLRTLIPSQPWSHRASPRKTIAFMNVFGMRSVLTTTAPALLPPGPGTAFISNAVMAIHSHFTFQGLLSKPLGLVAAQIRTDLAQQSTRSQVDAQARLMRNGWRDSGYAPVYGESDMAIAVISNWTKGRMFETDFSAAVVSGGRRAGSMRGRPSYVQADGCANGFSVRNSGCVVGRDGEGNYWVSAMLRPKVWDEVEKAIRRMA
ncbi:uncharacterized protein BDR25DRAFT_34308 [Lindgomyces ingoldianus]|uniref:Uncharacterized protein n=1 Tax=Lindgomyces ingoldianus TaxID=673940 RepID=A0ACB6QTP3_9PLEO|nr:uncharacterized protein BDR25DRAFT_34308 [Lindgomyces ingoldianus]KAF2470369.1 hypothetical protein BDR25DRAFT_34308 [Lindgomyces ingoldianus]